MLSFSQGLRAVFFFFHDRAFSTPSFYFPLPKRGSETCMNQDGLVQFRSGPQHNDILRLGKGGRLASLQLVVFAVEQFCSCCVL